MSRHSQLIAAYFFVVFQLTAASISQLSTFTATSATASWGFSVSFSITGPSVSVSGSGAYLGPPAFFHTGGNVSVDCMAFGCFELQELRGAPLIPECGVVIDGIGNGGACSGDAGFGHPPNFSGIVPSTPNPTLTVPATLIGGYDLCNPPFSVSCQNPIAHIAVDLPGELTLFFQGPLPPGVGASFESDYLQGAQFISTPIPESSSLMF
jgi:hypothetical protein